MKFSESALQHLREAIQRRELAILIGPDLPETLTGIPNWSELAMRLSLRAGFPAQTDWPLVSTRYEREFGRRDLINWLDGQINEKQTTQFYQLLASLPVLHYIIFTYDNMLQSALENVNRHSNIIINDSDLSFIKPELPTIVKLLGEASPGRRNTLLLSKNDLRDLISRQSAIMTQEVQPIVTGLNILIVGQDLRSKFFNDFYHHLTQVISLELRRRATAIWSDLEDWEVKEWNAKQVTILTVDAMDILLYLSGNVNAIKTGKSPDNVSGQTANWDIGRVRDFLMQAFSDEELTTISYDHFRPVSDNFTVGMSKTQKIQQLLDYCNRQDQLKALLEISKMQNPYQYQRFFPETSSD